MSVISVGVRGVCFVAHRFWRLQRHRVQPQIRTARRESGRTPCRGPHSLSGTLWCCRSEPAAWDGHARRTLRQNMSTFRAWFHLFYFIWIRPKKTSAGQIKLPEVGPQASLYPVAPGTLFQEMRAALVLTDDTFKVCTALLSTDTQTEIASL